MLQNHLLLNASLLPSLSSGGLGPFLSQRTTEENIPSPPLSKTSVSISESRTDQAKAKCILGTPEKSGDSTESILSLAFTVPQKVLLDRKRGNVWWATVG